MRGACFPGNLDTPAVGSLSACARCMNELVELARSGYQACVVEGLQSVMDDKARRLRWQDLGSVERHVNDQSLIKEVAC